MTGTAARPPTPEALQELLHRHRVWLASDGADGARAELAGACLAGLSLWRADLRGAAFDGVDLREANLDHARLEGASLEGTCLAGASLWEASLARARLRAADLRRAKLDHADLRDADLRAAGLAMASFWGTHLEGADLRGATGLAPHQLDAAFLDARTRLPALGSVPPMHDGDAAGAPRPACGQHGVEIGESYSDARRPRHLWRVTARYGDLCRLERVDRPNVIRYPTTAVLRDSTRYVRRG